MCGITGFWQKDDSVESSVIQKMTNVMAHRGPDDAGTWLDENAGLALGHRRLSILDLSPAGHQPMLSPCGRYALVYNGEIYNHSDLRNGLEEDFGGHQYRGHSDTEVLLVALMHWGVENTLARLNGMFAFAFWDRHERSLFLARDRMGIKPLYYGQHNGVFLFGSELKALTAHPAWRGEVDRDALALYLRHNCVPSPWSIYKGIFKLPPAHFVVVRDNGRNVSSPQCYWNLAEIAEQGSGSKHKSVEQLTSELDALLNDAVKKRMLADVPLGTFLSGGIDSTLVTALMQAQSDTPVRTFSIGVHCNEMDEARHAKAVAGYLGTDHTELYVTSREAMEVVPRLSVMWDEPFADSSQIPTFLVSQLARRYVTVSLSGDGGDELFAGYNRHIVGPEIWNKAERLPLLLRRLLGWGIGSLARYDVERLRRYLPQRMAVSNLAYRLDKLAGALNASNGQAFYKDLASHWKDPGSLVLGGKEPDTLLDKLDAMPDLPGLREQMMYLDQKTYLPDDILTKLDRASMAVSLEARVPLLDHRVVEFAWRVPSEFTYRNGQGKWLLRQVLYRYVPRKIMDRPKQGFGIPIKEWLCGHLRDWAEELLNEKRLHAEGFLDPAPIRRIWHDHVSGKKPWTHHLWAILMFQQWLQETRA
jgi:asparagine synthase (glutamine-hydrolysing)